MEKITCVISLDDSVHIYSLIASAARCLQLSDKRDKAKELVDRCFLSLYDRKKVITIILEYIIIKENYES